jgi:hypothetical protein
MLLLYLTWNFINHRTWRAVQYITIYRKETVCNGVSWFKLAMQESVVRSYKHGNHEVWHKAGISLTNSRL